jgi:hypothetical protein
MQSIGRAVRGRACQLGLVFGFALLASQSALAKEYYVATTGSDTAAGTIDEPFATLQKGANTAVAGDTVWIRGGTYSITTPNSSSAGVNFSKSGTSDTNRIKYWAYPGETPVFDFAKMTISTTGYTMGFSVSGSWLHFKGLELCNVPMTTFSNNALSVTSGGNDIFELLNMHHNSGNGIFIGSKTAGGHLILNCDAHDNYDATSNQGQGQNADGFGIHYQTTGESSIIRGCRAWWNSDDGYDLINHEVPVIVENSWAMGNGYADYGTFNPSSGNGNGFKMGSSKTGVRHIVRNNVAWKNKASGFYANHSSGGNTWYNNTSFQNGTQYNLLASDPNDSSVKIILSGSLVHIMRNNIGYPNKNTNMEGVDTAFNSWDLNITPAAKDFLSITDPSVSGTGQAIETTSPALGPRQADGSLPDVDFLKLVAGSQMIDKGTDVGLPFVGAAPDLGAYEYGETGGSPGTGGATGTGGSPGTGGASGTGGGSGTGGALGSGGATGSGGAIATGGRAGTGGTSAATGSGGVVGAGGSTAAGTGGGAATGGIISSGGAPGSGGAGAAVGSGGTSATSAAGSGGSVGAGGATASTAAQATTSGNGCSCRLVGAEPPSRLGLGLLALLPLAVRRRGKR